MELKCDKTHIIHALLRSSNRTFMELKSKKDLNKVENSSWF